MVLDFLDLMPPTMVARGLDEIREFRDTHGDIIIKPLEGMGGMSIFRLQNGDPNISVALETLTQQGSQYIMAQRFIPEISAGDKRILMVDGKAVPYALARIPKAGETRGNLAAGGRGEGIPLSERDRWICDQVGPTLKQKGLLFVGLDVNKDGIAQESEELCSSTSPTEIELCDLFTPVAGRYWVLVQNWEATLDPDEVTLKSAVVDKNSTSLLTATGTGIISAGEDLNVRLSWDNVSAVPGTELMGAVGIGTDRENPNNIGIIPVKFTKTGVEAPKTLVLMNGISRGLTLNGNGVHNFAFIDVPPGTDTLTVTANGADAEQSNNLAIELYRVDFNDAFADAPFASAPDTSGAPVASASGANGNGPEVNVTGGSLVPGRWYAVLKNNHADAAAVEVQADLTFTGDPIPLHTGLWESALVENLEKQGIDYTKSGIYRAFLWYSYDEDGSPTWYQVGGPEPEGNVWVAGLNRYTNDGSLQQSTSVGRISITQIAEQELIFSFVLFGEEGSDKQTPTSPPLCPEDNGSKKSYTGIWSREAIGVGGGSVMVNSSAQGYVHYIYDDRGNPIWLQTASAISGLPNGEEMTLSQWDGYCPTCARVEPTRDMVGLFTNNFLDEDNMTWTLDYVLESPLSGSVNRTDETSKLTTTMVCQ